MTDETYPVPPVNSPDLTQAARPAPCRGGLLGFLKSPTNPLNTTHMNHLPRHTPHSGQPALEPRHPSPNRKWFPIPLAGLVAVFACASCSESPSPAPPPIPITDTQPVGDGLKVIGFAMLGAACVVVLGRLIR